MPSNHVPAAIFERPHIYGDGKAKKYSIEVSQALQDDLRRHLEEEVGPKEQYHSWYSADFGQKAQLAFQSVGSPVVTVHNCWDIFQSMSQVLRRTL